MKKNNMTLLPLKIIKKIINKIYGKIYHNFWGQIPLPRNFLKLFIVNNGKMKENK